MKSQQLQATLNSLCITQDYLMEVKRDKIVSMDAKASHLALHAMHSATVGGGYNH